MQKSYYVYMLTNKSHSTLYIGVTNDVYRRTSEHSEQVVDGFAERYKADILVYAEEYSSINDALAREKQLKKWRREKKENLINQMNPQWKDLLRE